jgi:hypothetical protein
VESFYSTSWSTFVDAVNDTQNNKRINLRKTNSIKIHNFIKRSKLSTRKSNELIKLFQDLVPNSKKDIPSGFRQAQRYAFEGTTHHRESILDITLPPSSAVVHLPVEWRMDLWDERRLGSKPAPIALLARDPIACIAEQFMDPTIAILLKEHINFEYKDEYLSGIDFILFEYYF